MKNAGRWIRFLMACASVVAITSVTPAQTRSAARKAAPTARKARTPPRAADGRPDLQGIWANSTLTPLQRPKGFEDKAFFTEADAPAFQKAVLEGTLALLGEVELKTSGEFGLESGKLVPDRRTSLIIDPPNGTIPPLLPDAQRRLDASIERKKQHPADGPEDLNAAERCLLWPNQGAPPMLPPPYNPNIQIFQTHQYVAILIEMFHDARVIPLDGRPHPQATMRQWKGDSRGRWEGDTLVVDTTNFASTGVYNRFDALSGSDEGLHVIERFTRVDADTLLYQFTVDDPTAYTRQWSAKIPMTRTDDQMFEFACHEENYGMAHILSGARAEERAAAGESAKKP
jgi:hypothetical protein